MWVGVGARVGGSGGRGEEGGVWVGARKKEGRGGRGGEEECEGII